MFEVIRRLSKCLKAVIQFFFIAFIVYGLVIVTSIGRLDGTATFVLIGTLFAILLTEVFARAIVWIVSGYFENNPNSSLDIHKKTMMRDYYTARTWRSRLTAWSPKIK